MEMFKSQADRLRDADALIGEAVNFQEESLRATLLRVVGAAKTLNTDADAVDLALRLPLQLDDGIIAGVILTDLSRDPVDRACLVTNDKKDFSNPELLGYFEANHCRVLFGFEEACGFVGIRS